MSNNKIDTSTVFEMFETINRKLDKPAIEKSAESAQVDLSVVNVVTERLEAVVEEVRNPAKIEHKHRYTIDIASTQITH